MPKDWRKANVTPVFKKGKKEDPGNYRPVSLTSIPRKMVEKLILDVISKQVEAKKVIRSIQHGFTKGKSCLTNLIAFCDNMTGWVDEGKAVQERPGTTGESPEEGYEDGEGTGASVL